MIWDFFSITKYIDKDGNPINNKNNQDSLNMVNVNDIENDRISSTCTSVSRVRRWGGFNIVTCHELMNKGGYTYIRYDFFISRVDNRVFTFANTDISKVMDVHYEQVLSKNNYGMGYNILCFGGND